MALCSPPKKEIEILVCAGGATGAGYPVVKSLARLGKDSKARPTLIIRGLSESFSRNITSERAILAS